MSISSELLTLNNTKTAIRTAINNKGGSVGASDTFASYATAIDNLPTSAGNPIASSVDVSDFSGTTFTPLSNYITSAIVPNGVTRIATYAFNGYNRITSISLPNTLTTLDNSVFSACSSLATLTIPSSVTTIGHSCFENCSSITSLTIPNAITQIQYETFKGCASISSFTIPSGVTSIGYGAFRDCRLLTSITIPSNVVSIDYDAFKDCSGLNYVISFPTMPPTLGSNVFNNTNNCPIYVPSASVDTYKAANNWSAYASRIYPIQQVATVDGNPVYNYDLGMTSTDTITSENMAKMPAGTNLELAEGITWAGGATAFSNYTNLTLPSTFTTFGDQYMLDGLTTVTSKATTPPSAERNQIGGSSLTAIYVPAASVDTYKAAGGWSNYASRIQAIPSPSITITEYEGQEVIDNAVDFGDFPGCVDDTVAPDEFERASANSTFDSDLKAANIIVVEDDNGNDITSQCTFTSPDFSRWDSTQDPSWDGETPVNYLWVAVDTIARGDSQTPGSVSITATYGALTDTLYMGYSKTDIGCEPEPEPEPDPEEEPEE